MLWSDIVAVAVIGASLIIENLRKPEFTHTMSYYMYM